MAILRSLRSLLEDHHVPYEVHVHRLSYTARDTAVADHIPPSEMAKVLVLRGRDQLLMAVLPASHTLDLECLRKTVGDPQLRLAAERELVEACPACEAGAIPPFGQLFDMPLWVDDSLGRERETVFNGGNHCETVHVAYEDFVRIAKPQFGEFSRRSEFPA